ncbi:DUF6528 family protein [Sphingobium sp. AS12]|uniref:DUF6528 family protein n=1 Tax=Sphingobium sp. AS12 TaxID=2849495 RepID=UPI0034A4D06A
MTAQLLACGDDQIRLYEGADNGMRETWRWTAQTAPGLPAVYRTTLLRKIDDCKAVDGGKAILATASTGAVVLVDRASGKVLFRARAPMAHSADLLPDGRIAVALSLHEAGNRLEIYSRTKNEKPLLHLDLYSGHGAVWDAQRQRLFTLSHDMIQAFRLEDWATRKPRLIETQRWQLPGKRDGHDLSLDPDTHDFAVTTEDGSWRFSPESGEYVAIPFLNPARQVKAINFNGDSVAWVQAEDSWWSYGFTVAKRDGSARERINVTGIHLYKIRWFR